MYPGMSRVVLRQVVAVPDIPQKEALGTVWACKKYAGYIATDHRPLVPLLITTSNYLPPWALWFSYASPGLTVLCIGIGLIIVHRKFLYTAGTLSCVPVTLIDDNKYKEDIKIELFVYAVISCQWARTTWENIEIPNRETLHVLVVRVLSLF